MLHLIFSCVFLCISLNDLQEFIKAAEAGMSTEPKQGDLEGLISVMKWLNQVKDRMATTDDMFDPLKKICVLLSTYGQEMPEEIYHQLAVGRIYSSLTHSNLHSCFHSLSRKEWTMKISSMFPDFTRRVGQL
jgi:hypothetical protein